MEQSVDPPPRTNTHSGFLTSAMCTLPPWYDTGPLWSWPCCGARQRVGRSCILPGPDLTHEGLRLRFRGWVTVRSLYDVSGTQYCRCKNSRQQKVMECNHSLGVTSAETRSLSPAQPYDSTALLLHDENAQSMLDTVPHTCNCAPVEQGHRQILTEGATYRTWSVPISVS